MKTIASRWQTASIFMIVLNAVLTIMVAGSGFEPVLLAALLITFMGQMSCFTLVGLSDDDQWSTILNDRKHFASMVVGTAISVIPILTIMLWKLFTVTLRQ